MKELRTKNRQLRPSAQQVDKGNSRAQSVRGKGEKNDIMFMTETEVEDKRGPQIIYKPQQANWYNTKSKELTSAKSNF